MQEIRRNMKAFILKLLSCEDIILSLEYTIKNTKPGRS